MQNLKQKFETEIKPELQKELGLKNTQAVPVLKKIVVNVGLGEALGDSKVLEKVAAQIAIITGQKPLVTRAKVSISTFKLRAGDRIGLKVTLRGQRMYDFLTKLITITLPRVRDFRGIPRTAFDGQGSYNLGISEQIVFGEIDYDKIDRIRGLQVTLVTSAKDNQAGLALLTKLGLPFTKEV